MPNNTVSDWSVTPASNTEVGGVDLAENSMRPRDVNNAIRTMMAQIATGIDNSEFGSAYFSPASASSAAYLDFREDTDNGTNRVRVIAPAAVAADRTFTLPDVDVTISTFGASLMDDAAASNGRATLGLATTTTDNAVARFDSTAGATQNSGVIVDDSNNVSGIGTLASGAVAATTGAGVSPVVGTLQAANAFSAGFVMQKRGHTSDATAAVGSGGEIGYHEFKGWDGSAYGRAAYVIVSATEAFTGSAHGGKYTIVTTTTGTTSEGARVTIGPGVQVGSPTGGDKGAGTINANDVYNDNVALTCMALQAEFLKSGTVDIEKWDALVPDIVIPERRESVPLTYTITETKPVEVTKEEGGRLVRRLEVRPVERKVPVVWAEPVYDDKGTIVDAVETPLFDEVVTPEKVTPRVHGTARLFAAMLAEGFDPRDPAQYIAKLKSDQALPGMPSLASWQHNEIGSGEMFMRLWLASEMMALVTMNLHDRVSALEAVRRRA